MDKEPTKNYISRVILSGYKSIENLDISLQPGLNIIIGKNGTGKTNFLRFLKMSLDREYSRVINFNTKLTFTNSVNIELSAKRDLLSITDLNKTITMQDLLKEPSVEFTIAKGKKITSFSNKETESLIKELEKNNLNFDSIKISHGLLEDFPLFKAPFQFSINKDGLPSELVLQVAGKSTFPLFIKNLFWGLILQLYPRLSSKIFQLKKEEIKEIILKAFNAIKFVEEYLTKYSIISGIELSDDFNVFINTEKEQINLTNLIFKFKINNNWHLYEDLSDGTKRIFYIITELAFLRFGEYPVFDFLNAGVDNKQSRIALIEEPELGIHPHQLHQLMLFIKEESNVSQIILTTHSPQVLDILDSDELNRIIISDVDLKGVTNFRNLNKSQIKKAQSYMEDAYLSDYWRHSDLEPR